MAEEALAALPQHRARMTEQRVAFSKAALTGPRAGIVLPPSVEARVASVNDYAPEHLEILSPEPSAHLDRNRHVVAGAEMPVGRLHLVARDAAGGPAVARRKAAETHAEAATCRGLRIADGAGKSVGRQPHRQRIGLR